MNPIAHEQLRFDRRAVGLLTLLLLCSGCGYTWKSTYREDVRTVAIPIFQNKTYERGVEFALTKAVANRLELHSPYKVTSRDRADTILEGEITECSIKTLSHDLETDVPQEQQVTMTVDFVWKDMRTGQILRERRNFQRLTTYYPTLGEGQYVANQKGVEWLALAIVQELEADW